MRNNNTLAIKVIDSENDIKGAVKMEKGSKEFCYIYNKDQSDFYFSEGIVPFKTGKGALGDDYVKFRNTESLRKAFAKWCDRKH